MLAFIPFPKAIEQSIDSYFYVVLDNAFKIEQKVECRSDDANNEIYFKMRSNKRHGRP